MRREYPVGRVGFLMLAAPARGETPEEAEAVLLRAFIREALEWGFGPAEVGSSRRPRP